MRLFNRKASFRAENTLFSTLNRRLIHYQHLIADYLNHRLQFLSGKTLLFSLVIFCAVLGAYCLYLITTGFNSSFNK